jgi:hypothetical protein
MVRYVARHHLALLALFVALAGTSYAAFDPVGGDGDIDACFERKSGDLDLLKGNRCSSGERRVTWSQGGPQGPAGPQGEPGPEGAPGQGATNAIMGSNVSGSPLGSGGQFGDVLSPSGQSVPKLGTAPSLVDMPTPNSILVARDLFVSVAIPPGGGKSWGFELFAGSAQQGYQNLACQISGSDRDCNSGDQEITIPPGTPMWFYAVAVGGPPATDVNFAWRATAP